MASLVIIALVAVVAGLVFGAYLIICLAISREDRKASLGKAAASPSARSARFLVGIGGAGRRY